MVLVHLFLPASQGVEVTVVALALTKGDMDVNAKDTGHAAHSSHSAAAGRLRLFNFLLYDALSGMARNLGKESGRN